MPRSPQIVSLAGALLFVLSAAAVAQNGHPPMSRDSAQSDASLAEDLAELRAKVARLEAALEQNHRDRSDHGDLGSHQPGMGDMENRPRMGGDGMKGMKDMGSGGGMPMPMGREGDGMAGMSPMGGERMKGMEMDGEGMGDMPPMDGQRMKGMGMDGMGMGMGQMNGMNMMGMMKGMSGLRGRARMAMNSALPGFPGASHLYHVGATGFFLDHDEHIELTAEQMIALNKIKEASLLARNTADRQIEEAEQQLWELTAADTPDANRIEEKIREIERLRGDQRLQFIQAVGKAASVLTAEQRQSLMGTEPTQPSSDTQPASDAQHQH